MQLNKPLGGREHSTRVWLTVGLMLASTCCELATGAQLLASSLYPASSGNVQHNCPTGAPVQWRPYLDVASKAHLAPVVAVGSLRNLNLTPIQLSAGGDSLMTGPQQQQQPIAFHAQSVNNVGVNIEATFVVLNVLKRTVAMNLNSSQSIKLFYKVSASLTTTSALMTLANSNSGSNSGEAAGASLSSAGAHSQLMYRQLMLHRQRAPCALELSEHELVKKANKIFKLNRNYILFLDGAGQLQPGQSGSAASSSRPGSRLSGWPQQADQAVHPFASHELLTNQTSRALRKILCKNCAQVPQVQLLNATFVSLLAEADRKRKWSADQRAARVKLDCRAQGYPAPWIEWYKNGRPLRNRPGGHLWVRTNKWRRRQNVRLSRLELELAPGRNETGVYECRAMNVVAREPTVGAYTLLVLAAQYALVPMQPELVAPGTPTRAPPAAEEARTTAARGPPAEQALANNSIQQEWPVVGQACPREAHDNFCLNKGTCVLIGHIEEYYCNCAEGYHGHRCEYKSLGHQQAS